MRRASDSVRGATPKFPYWQMDHGGHEGQKRPLRQVPEWEQGSGTEGISKKGRIGTEI